MGYCSRVLLGPQFGLVSRDSGGCWHGSWVCFSSPCGLNHLFTATAKFCLVVYLSQFCLLGAVCLLCVWHRSVWSINDFCISLSLFLSLYFFNSSFLSLCYYLLLSFTSSDIKKIMYPYFSQIIIPLISYREFLIKYINIINTATGLYQCLKPSVIGGALFMWERCIKSNIL